VHRANRHHARQTLLAATGPTDADGADSVEQRLAGRRPVVFRKWPDLPLSEYLRQRSG
jgi:hypothetical protein